jgi:hypothetical protein
MFSFKGRHVAGIAIIVWDICGRNLCTHQVALCNPRWRPDTFEKSGILWVIFFINLFYPSQLINNYSDEWKPHANKDPMSFTTTSQWRAMVASFLNGLAEEYQG